MSDPSDKPAPQNPASKTPAEVMAELVAKKAAARGYRPGETRESEQKAAARSASKSKPAMRR